MNKKHFMKITSNKSSRKRISAENEIQPFGKNYLRPADALPYLGRDSQQSPSKLLPLGLQP